MSVFIPTILYTAYSKVSKLSAIHSHTHTQGVSSGECRNIVALNPTSLNLPLIRVPINHAKAAKEPASQPARLACSLALSPIRQANVMHATGADHQLLHAGWSDTKAITITQSLRILQICQLQS